MQLELYLAERKTGSCCIIQVTVSPHHAEFSGVFLKLINIYIDWIAGLHCLATIHIGKIKTWEKTIERAFRKCSGSRCSEILSKIHMKVSVPDSQLNVVAGLQLATLLRKRPQHMCFPVINLHTFKFSCARMFLTTF